jgi:hypothetical protein
MVYRGIDERQIKTKKGKIKTNIGSEKTRERQG